jgi:hypothetical protein
LLHNLSFVSAFERIRDNLSVKKIHKILFWAIGKCPSKYGLYGIIPHNTLKSCTIAEKVPHKILIVIDIRKEIHLRRFVRGQAVCYAEKDISGRQSFLTDDTCNPARSQPKLHKNAYHLIMNSLRSVPGVDGVGNIQRSLSVGSESWCRVNSENPSKL